MKKVYFSLAALLAVGAAAPVVQADEFSFSFHSGSITTSGVFTTAPTSTPGYDAITGINGTFSDTSAGISGAITGLYRPVSYAAPPSGPPASTPAGISYDDTFYPGANSPNNCADYPFYGGVFDVYGLAFDVSGGYVAALWSDGNMPGVGLVYAAGDSQGTTLLNLPNPDGSNQSLPVGVPGSLTTSSTPEPASLLLSGLGIGGAMLFLRRKRTILQ
ncbi:MAG: PEP-CTERM sorting domain-containing protein [Acidobacteriaceae bacterium]|nr:PEP-CTERM sorting domain-containing protein [Acidobacteriaceae bacterium]